MRGRLVFISQYWWPEIGAPQNRLGALARGIRGRGWRVAVITAQPNYPFGRVLEGYRRFWWSFDEEDGLLVLRCPIFSSRSRRTLLRMACYLSFVVTSAIAGLWVVRKKDVLFVESPPLFVGLSARIVSFMRRCQYVFNVSDLWPDSAVEMGWVDDGRLVNLARRLEHWIYEGSLALTGQSPSIIEVLTLRAHGKPVELLTNSVDVERFENAIPNGGWRGRLPVGPEGLVAIYAGLHGVAQGLNQILDAAALLKVGEEILIVFVGDGPEKPNLMKQAQEASLRNVVFHEAVSHNQIPGLLAAADIALIPLKFELTGAVPSKIYEAMAAGLPIVYVGGGDARKLFQETGAGICCEIGDAVGIAKAVQQLAHQPKLRQEMGERGRAVATERFHRSAVATRLELFLERLLGGVEHQEGSVVEKQRTPASRRGERGQR